LNLFITYIKTNQLTLNTQSESVNVCKYLVTQSVLGLSSVRAFYGIKTNSKSVPRNHSSETVASLEVIYIVLVVSVNNMKIDTATVAFTTVALIAFTTLSVCSFFMMAVALWASMMVV
jgi:hypothetical protein